MKKTLLFFPFLLALLGFNAASAQNDVDLFIGDMLIIADNFASPGAEGATFQSSAGWFTSGSSMKKWQIEISVHGNGLFIPKSKQRNIYQDGAIVKVRGDSRALVPTVFGGNTDVVYEGQIQNPFTGQNVNFSFDAIDGFDKRVLVHPFIQATVGLPYNTEFAARYLPKVNVNGVEFSTYGAGLKHNFTQYYERRYDPQDFQLAALITYSNFTADYAFTPVVVQNVLELDRIDVNADLWLLQVLGSKLYGNFEVYGGLGVTNSTFDYEMGGSGLALDPLNTSLATLGDAEAKFKGDLGFNYYFGKFKFSSMFTASSFFNVNAGLHFRP